MMKASIIIPCKTISDYAIECADACRKLDWDDVEIILLPDKAEEKIGGVAIIPAGSASPGKKRNIGIGNAKGEIVAFIDDDAYPRGDWLKNAIKLIKNDVVAVGGPGVTPQGDSFMQKAGGFINSSLMAGGLSSRFRTAEAKESDDIHSCNFIAKRSVFGKVSWNEKYWPGEDTLLCLDIKKQGRKIIESPDVVVYHHRRSLFVPHLRQVSRFALHRGFFAKRYPETSMRPSYFLPSAFVMGLVSGIPVSFFIPPVGTLMTAVLSLYAVLLAVSSAFSGRYFIPVFLGTFLTHITYGIFFIKGLFSKELKR